MSDMEIKPELDFQKKVTRMKMFAFTCECNAPLVQFARVRQVDEPTAELAPSCPNCGAEVYILETGKP